MCKRKRVVAKHPQPCSAASTKRSAQRCGTVCLNSRRGPGFRRKRQESRRQNFNDLFERDRRIIAACALVANGQWWRASGNSADGALEPTALSYANYSCCEPHGCGPHKRAKAKSGAGDYCRSACCTTLKGAWGLSSCVGLRTPIRLRETVPRRVKRSGAASRRQAKRGDKIRPPFLGNRVGERSTRCERS